MEERRTTPYTVEEILSMNLRKSSVMSYGFCPYRFALDGLLNIPSEPTEVMIKGTEFHDNVWNLYKQVRKELILNGQKTIAEEYGRYLPDDLVSNNFIEMEIQRFEYLEEVRRLDTFFPLLTEKRMVNEKMRFSGTVDRVDKDEDDEYLVCDYKTSPAIKDWMKSHYRFELVGYALLVDTSNDSEVREKITKKVKNVCIIFPKPMDVFYTKIKPVSVAAFHRRCDKCRKGIESGDFHKIDEGGGHRMCEPCPRWDDCILGVYDEAVDLLSEGIIKAVEG